MKPGVCYFAGDGSWVKLQRLITQPQVFNPGTPAQFVITPPDRLVDVRLLCYNPSAPAPWTAIRIPGRLARDTDYGLLEYRLLDRQPSLAANITDPDDWDHPQGDPQ